MTRYLGYNNDRSPRGNRSNQYSRGGRRQYESGRRHDNLTWRADAQQQFSDQSYSYQGGRGGHRSGRGGHDSRLGGQGHNQYRFLDNGENRRPRPSNDRTWKPEHGVVFQERPNQGRYQQSSHKQDELYRRGRANHAQDSDSGTLFGSSTLREDDDLDSDASIRQNSYHSYNQADDFDDLTDHESVSVIHETDYTYLAEHRGMADMIPTLSDRAQAEDVVWHICPHCILQREHRFPPHHIASNVNAFEGLRPPPTETDPETGEVSSVLNGMHVWGVGIARTTFEHNDRQGCSTIELRDVCYIPDYRGNIAWTVEDPIDLGGANGLNVICVEKLRIDGHNVDLQIFHGISWLRHFGEAPHVMKDQQGNTYKNAQGQLLQQQKTVLKSTILAVQHGCGVFQLTKCTLQGQHGAHPARVEVQRASNQNAGQWSDDRVQYDLYKPQQQNGNGNRRWNNNNNNRNKNWNNKNRNSNNNKNNWNNNNDNNNNNNHNNRRNNNNIHGNFRRNGNGWNRNRQ